VGPCARQLHPSRVVGLRGISGGDCVVLDCDQVPPVHIWNRVWTAVVMDEIRICEAGELAIRRVSSFRRDKFRGLVWGQF
jgi:hypothetical protein